MTDRPMIFSAPMVRALLAGSKTQTRRALRDGTWWTPEHGVIRQASAGLALTGFAPVPCPYGAPRDNLWVREAWHTVDGERAFYRADFAHDQKGDREHGVTWRSPIHMPRWASRITLEVVSVRVERLQDISEADALAEGIDMAQPVTMPFSPGSMATVTMRPRSAREAYAALWVGINGPGSWDLNPWVWCVEFRAVKP